MSLRYGLLLLVPPAWSILRVLAHNPVGVPHAERLVGLVLAIWVIAVLVALTAIRAGFPPRATVGAMFFALVLLLSGRGIVDRVGFLGSCLAIAGAVTVVFLLFRRMEDSVLPDALIMGTVVALLAGVVIAAFGSYFDSGESMVLEVPDSEVVEFQRRPDVILLVFDGHPGLRALDLDFDRRTSNSFRTSLETVGYDLSESAWSAYATTAHSVPSLLDARYPVEDVAESTATTRQLYEIVAGENQTRSVMESNDYDTFMVESTWSGGACGGSYDHCVASPFLDESMFVATERSVFGSLVLERYGHAFTAGTQGTMEWLGEKARALTHDGAPTFIFGHVMAPHPPFFLDADCTRVVSEQRTGVSFQRDGVDPGLRERFLIDQMNCLHSFLAELSELVSDETVVVVVSDHGTDRRGQLARDAATWTEADLTERMNVLAAVRGLDDCPLPEALVVPNIMRHVFSCLSGEDLTLVRPRMFPGAGVELDDESVEMLIG